MHVEWSEHARDDLAAILRYVSEGFGLSIANRVKDEIGHDINTLTEFPLMGVLIHNDSKTNISYRSLSSKYHKLVYSIQGETLYIVTIWNTRHDNKKLVTLLKRNV